MDTSSEYNTVLQKKQMNAPVSYREIAVAIANHEETLLQFLADNDPNQVYALLHRSDSPMTVGENATFIPDKKRVEGELKSLFVKKDFATLNDIVDNFRINTSAKNYTANANVISSLCDIDAITMTPTGYRFNLTFS